MMLTRKSMRRKPLFGGVLLLCAVLALAACGGGSSPAASSSSSSGANSTAKAQAILQHVQTDLRNGTLRNASFTTTENVKTAQSITATSKSTGAMDVSPFAAKLATTTSGGGQQYQTNEIVANSRAYAKTTSQTQWHEVNLPQNAQQNLPMLSLQNLTNLQHLRYVGTQTVDGVKTDHIQGTAAQSADGQTAGYTEDLWVNSNNDQPVQMMIQSTSSQATITATTSFYSWNSGVSISPPAPTAIAP